MKLKILTEEEKKITYREQILDMMRAADNDFVPPMSARFSPFQTDLKGGDATESGIIRYYNGMVNEQMLCAIEDGNILGFVTYVENLKNKVFPEDAMPNLYICTLIFMINPSYIATKFFISLNKISNFKLLRRFHLFPPA